MKLHNYAEDPLVKRLTELSQKASPGPWHGAACLEGADSELAVALVNAWRSGTLYVVMGNE